MLCNEDSSERAAGLLCKSNARANCGCVFAGGDEKILASLGGYGGETVATTTVS